MPPAVPVEVETKVEDPKQEEPTPKPEEVPEVVTDEGPLDTGCAEESQASIDID